MLTATLGNGLTMTQNWGNDGGWRASGLYQTAGGTNLSLLTYGYDNDDNIISIVDGVDPYAQRHYDYDAVNRAGAGDPASGSVRRRISCPTPTAIGRARAPTSNRHASALDRDL